MVLVLVGVFFFFPCFGSLLNPFPRSQIEASFDPRALPTTGTILEVETPAVLEAEAEAAATTSTATTSGAIALEDDGSDDGGRRLEASESTSSLGVMDSS